MGKNVVSIMLRPLYSCLTICCFTNACGFSASSINVLLHLSAERLKLIPGTQFGRFLTRTRKAKILVIGSKDFGKQCARNGRTSTSHEPALAATENWLSASSARSTSGSADLGSMVYPCEIFRMIAPAFLYEKKILMINLSARKHC